MDPWIKVNGSIGDELHEARVVLLSVDRRQVTLIDSTNHIGVALPQARAFAGRSHRIQVMRRVVPSTVLLISSDSTHTGASHLFSR